MRGIGIEIAWQACADTDARLAAPTAQNII
jgi:hypothetical protein